MALSRFFQRLPAGPSTGTLSAYDSSGSNEHRSAERDVNIRKRFRPASNRSPKGAPIAGNMVRMAVVFSQDESIIGLIRDGLTEGWRIDPCSEPNQARMFLQRADVGIVVIDDVAIDKPSCGWLLDQVHRWTPDALVAYIASAHTPETERQVRSLGVQYYLSRPVDRERTIRVLHSFAAAQL